MGLIINAASKVSVPPFLSLTRQRVLSFDFPDLALLNLINGLSAAAVTNLTILLLWFYEQAELSNMSGVEVLSFLGTLAAASQLVEQSIKVVNFISDLYTKVHDAPESIKEQIVQIEQLVGIATLIRQIPSLQTDYSVASSLHRCQNEAKELIDIFLKLSVVPGDGKAKKLRKTLDWISKEKKILGHLRKLEQEKSSLVLCIATIDW